ncbi:hypothetical protein IEQ34_000776 [Dendrobium chrysotoxum]|uniref:Uncharacterized protein n=1 Tax=Dendrobium chrysotoxum TaxID=161865 RepID=A0AAV7HUI3_DENCH|nr:hypothetical protein IEQ34_000776 [Dendrobium chrysotoxum]
MVSSSRAIMILGLLSQRRTNASAVPNFNCEVLQDAFIGRFDGATGVGALLSSPPSACHKHLFAKMTDYTSLNDTSIQISFVPQLGPSSGNMSVDLLLTPSCLYPSMVDARDRSRFGEGVYVDDLNPLGLHQVDGKRSSIQSFVHNELIDELWDDFFGPLFYALADLLKKNSFNPCFMLDEFVEGFVGFRLASEGKSESMKVTSKKYAEHESATLVNPLNAPTTAPTPPLASAKSRWFSCFCWCPLCC